MKFASPLTIEHYNNNIVLLRGGMSVAQREVQSKVLRVWAMAPRYWVAADALNFSLVPLRLRPMTNALFSIPWGMYISSVANAPA